MSLRIRLFLLFSSLIIVLLGAQWWMWRSLTGKLDHELDAVAFKVGSGVAQFFTDTDKHAMILPMKHAENGPSTRIESGYSYSTGDSSTQPELRTTYTIRRIEGHTKLRTVTPAPEGSQRVEVLPTDASGLTWATKVDDQEPAKAMVQVHTIQTRDGKVTEKVMVGKEAIQALNQRGEELPLQEHELETKTLVLSLDQDALVMGDDAVAVKRIPIPKSGLSESLARARSKYLLGSTGVLVIGLLLAAMAAHRFAQPLRQLAGAASQVGEGHFGLQVEGPRQGGEVGVAIGAFNKMSLRLRELDEQTRDLQQRQYLSELGEIANGLAHTLRNPLNTLGLSVEQLAALGAERPESHELAQTARQQIRRIDQWIRSFLALASQGVAQEQRLNLRSIIQDVVLEAVQDGSKTVDIDLDLADELPHCPGVAPEMRAVVQALVVNAVEASPSDGKVTIRLYADDEAIHIEVADQGAGLEPSVRERLFTPHTTTKATGSGMGLFLANRIVSTRYRGQVSLSDHPEGGTLARVTLPLTEPLHA